MGQKISTSVSSYTGPAAPRALSEYDRAVMILTAGVEVDEDTKIRLIEGLSGPTAYRIATRFAGTWIEGEILGHVRRLVEAGRLWTYRRNPRDDISLDEMIHGPMAPLEWCPVGPEIRVPPMQLPGVLRGILHRWATNPPVQRVEFRALPGDPPNLVIALAPYPLRPGRVPTLRDLCLGRL